MFGLNVTLGQKSADHLGYEQQVRYCDHFGDPSCRFASFSLWFLFLIQGMYCAIAVLLKGFL